MRRILGILALCLLLPAASAHASSFRVGTGQNPGAAIDDTGTAYVGWQVNTGEPGDAIQLCVLPVGRRACASLTTIAFPGEGYNRSRVSILLAGPGTVDVIVPRNADGGNATYLARSTDAGVTFAPAIKISDYGFEQAVPGPDGRIALVSGITLHAGLVGSDGSGAATEGSPLGDILDGQFNDIATQGAEVIAASSSAGGSQAYRLPAGGDPNAPDAWQRLSDLTLGRQPEVAGGPAGLVAMLEPPGNSPAGLFVQRLVGVDWTPPVQVTGDSLNNDFELAGAGGRLSALRTAESSPYRLRYASSGDGGQLWSSEVSIASYGPFPTSLEAATTADGRGVAVVDFTLEEDEQIRVTRFRPALSPVRSKRIGGARVQVRAVCDGLDLRLVVEARRDGARIRPAAVLRRAVFGRARGARRVARHRFSADYDLTRSRARIPVRFRPRGNGRSRVVRLPVRRCG